MKIKPWAWFNNMKNDPRTILLLSGYQWGLEEDKYALSDAITIGRAEGSNFEKLYLDCWKKGMTPKDDPGCPSEYKVYVLINECVDNEFVEGPYVTTSRLVNILNLCTNSIIEFALMMFCDQRFKKIYWVEEIYDTHVLTFGGGFMQYVNIDKNSIEVIKQSWNTSEAIISNANGNNRITNALDYFSLWLERFLL